MHNRQVHLIQISLFLIAIIIGTFACSLTQNSSSDGQEQAQQIYTETPILDPNAVIVRDAVWNCFISLVAVEGDEYITYKGFRIKNISWEGIEPTDSLSSADIANGIIWSGYLGMKAIVNMGEEWEDEKIFMHNYFLYENGLIKILMVSGHKDYTCGIMTNGEAYMFR